MEMAKALEPACFDYSMIEDKLSVSESYGGSSEAYLKHALGMVPKHDPAPLAALMSAATKRLGIVITMSAIAYPPFLLARLSSTLDHISSGRFGWNIVTSAEDYAARNFGMDQLPARQIPRLLGRSPPDAAETSLAQGRARVLLRQICSLRSAKLPRH